MLLITLVFTHLQKYNYKSIFCIFTRYYSIEHDILKYCFIQNILKIYSTKTETIQNIR